MRAAVLELNPRSSNEVPHGLGDQYLAWSGLGGDSGADVDGPASDLAVDQLAFAHVQADLDLYPELEHRLLERTSTVVCL